MSSLINSAMSGLSAAQSALNTTANNISSYTVAGYNRQITILTPAVSTFSGNAWYGNGVIVNGVQRQYDALIDSQLREASAKNSGVNSHLTEISYVDSLMSLDGNTLNDEVQSFFKNIQNVVNNAADPSARQAMLTDAQSLSSRFRTMQEAFNTQQSNINSQITESVKSINSYAQQIASLNNQISRLSSSGQQPNNLLDQRDQLVSELNQITNVDVSMQDGNMVVSLNNGFILVNGKQNTELKAIPSSSNPQQLTLGYTDKQAGDVELPERLFSEGSLGGLLTYRRDDLSTIQNQLGLMVASFADEMNQVQAQGYDLNGDPGQDMFTFGSPEVTSNTHNLSETTLTASFSDISQLKASDYEISFQNGGWQVTRLSDNSQFTVEAQQEDGNTTLSFDGLSVQVSGQPSEKDRFLVQPLRSVALSFSVAITDGSQIAAASEYGGESDNRNAQQMLALQDKKIVGGQQTLNQAWASTVSYVGSQTSSLKGNAETYSQVVTQLTARQQSVSGVNLDEEYANLTQYQQYYIANTQVLSTASTLFDALISVTS